MALDVDGGLGSSLRPATHHRHPHAERARLPQEDGSHRLDRRRIAQHAHGVGGAALLHDDRRDPRVVGTCREQHRHGVGEHFAGHVVDVRFEESDGRAVVAGCGGQVADDDLDDVGALGRVGSAGAVADCLGGHRWHRSEPGGQGGHQRDTGRGATLRAWCRSRRSTRLRRRAVPPWRVPDSGSRRGRCGPSRVRRRSGCTTPRRHRGPPAPRTRRRRRRSSRAPRPRGVPPLPGSMPWIAPSTSPSRTNTARAR